MLLGRLLIPIRYKETAEMHKFVFPTMKTYYRYYHHYYYYYYYRTTDTPYAVNYNSERLRDRRIGSYIQQVRGVYYDNCNLCHSDAKARNAVSAGYRRVYAVFGYRRIL